MKWVQFTRTKLNLRCVYYESMHEKSSVRVHFVFFVSVDVRKISWLQKKTFHYTKHTPFFIALSIDARYPGSRRAESYAIIIKCIKSTKDRDVNVKFQWKNSKVTLVVCDRYTDTRIRKIRHTKNFLHKNGGDSRID